MIINPKINISSLNKNIRLLYLILILGFLNLIIINKYNLIINKLNHNSKFSSLIFLIEVFPLIFEENQMCSYFLIT